MDRLPAADNFILITRERSPGHGLMEGFPLMMRSTGPVLLLLIGLLTLNGCAVFNRSYIEPEVTLTNVEMLKANLWEQSFRLRLRVDNPNDRNLPIRGMHYQVHLNDMRLATGVTDRSFNRSEERRVGKECRYWWWV